MSECAAVNQLSVEGLPPRLCNAVEGVEFWIASSKGERIRCVITEAALQSHFGAREFPDSWLYAFQQHRADIERHALEASARRADVHVVLVNDSMGRLKVSAGRCRP